MKKRREQEISRIAEDLSDVDNKIEEDSKLILENIKKINDRLFDLKFLIYLIFLRSKLEGFLRSAEKKVTNSIVVCRKEKENEYIDFTLTMTKISKILDYHNLYSAEEEKYYTRIERRLIDNQM